MGSCVSSSLQVQVQGRSRKAEDKWRESAKVVDIEGRLEEFRQAVRAEEVLSRHPNCYLCSSDTILLNSNAPQLPLNHVLQLGQIYFLMPLSKSLTPLSLPDLCNLAIKTASALNTAHPLLYGCKTFRFSSHPNYTNTNISAS